MDVLLLHGAGGSAAVWEGFELPGFTTHAVELQGPWTWEALLDSVEALGLDNPAVVGQSLGGALAVRWAKRHPECPAVVNLDGHGHPSTYPGLSNVDEWKRKVEAAFDEQAEILAKTRPELLPIRELIANELVTELYDGLTSPALLVVASRLMAVQEPFAEYYTAVRKGVLADLAGRENVLEFDSSHDALNERRAELAVIVTDFLREKAG